MLNVTVKRIQHREQERPTRGSTLFQVTLQDPAPPGSRPVDASMIFSWGGMHALYQALKPIIEGRVTDNATKELPPERLPSMYPSSRKDEEVA